MVTGPRRSTNLSILASLVLKIYVGYLFWKSHSSSERSRFVTVLINFESFKFAAIFAHNILRLTFASFSIQLQSAAYRYNNVWKNSLSYSLFHSMKKRTTVYQIVHISLCLPWFHLASTFKALCIVKWWISIRYVLKWSNKQTNKSWPGIAATFLTGVEQRNVKTRLGLSHPRDKPSIF